MRDDSPSEPSTSDIKNFGGNRKVAIRSTAVAAACGCVDHALRPAHRLSTNRAVYNGVCEHGSAAWRDYRARRSKVMSSSRKSN